MRHFYSFIFFCLLLSAFSPLEAQNKCYEDYLKEGIDFFVKKKYNDAKAKFLLANGCPRRSKDLKEADDYLKKIEKILNPPPQLPPPPIPPAHKVKDTTSIDPSKPVNPVSPTVRENLDSLKLAEKKKQAEATQIKRQKSEDSVWSVVDECRTSYAYKCFKGWYPSSKHLNEADKYITNFMKQKPPKPETVLIKKKTFDFPTPGGTGKETFRVSISEQYIGIYEVSNTEFCMFLNEMGYRDKDSIPYIHINSGQQGEFCRIRKKGLKYVVEDKYEDFPVIFVTWYGARDYCEWMNTKYNAGYQLPAETLLEYVGQIDMVNGDPLTDVDLIPEVNSKDPRDKVPGLAKCKSFKPNKFKLYHIIGNVAEWCADNWVGDEKSIPTDGKPYKEGNTDKKTIRGGAWNQMIVNCYPANRTAATAKEGYTFVGFRIASKSP